MKRFSIGLAGLMVMSVVAMAQEAAAPATPPSSDCSTKATEKKLAGAALNSFMKKCERDAATTSCNASAADKKLKGAAKKSFVTKCVKDATAQ